MKTFQHHHVQFGRRGLNRRSFLRGISAATMAAGTLSFRDVLGLQAAELKRQNRSMILLWMQGGPSQFETFDPKPGTSNGGSTAAIQTPVSGIQIAEAWPETAKVMNDLALVRSMTNREGNHQRATYQMHTGYLPSGSVKHPMLGCNIAKEIADPDLDLPSVVSVGPTIGAGYLGVDFEPFVVSSPGQLPQNVAVPVVTARYQRRLKLLDRLEDEFAGRGGEVVVDNHRRLYRKASQMVLSEQTRAFDISAEPEALRRQYGNSSFGRGCLLARRLVESGVSFVEVRMGNWDTHQDNFTRTTELAGQVDPAMAALITDLKQRGLLERTVVVWMGEFGRTPRINPRTGRDHYPRVFNIALAGGGVKGGRVVGASTADGTAVADRPVEVADLFCSICKSLNIDPRAESLSPLGRPMKIIEGGTVVDELFV